MNDSIYRVEPIRWEGNIPVFSAGTRYTENYEQISGDHLSALRDSGENPFIPEDIWKQMEDSTADLVTRHSGPGDKVLDVGVGLGRLLSRFPDRERYGIDISFGYLEKAQAEGIDVAYALVDEMPYESDVFDVVVCTDVLEHVLDLNSAVRQILRVLKPGGRLIVRVPFNEDLGGYLDGPYEFIHLRNFDEAGLRLLFERVFGCVHLETQFGGWIRSEGTCRFTVPKLRFHRWIDPWISVLARFDADRAVRLVRRLYRPLEINVVVVRGD